MTDEQKQQEGEQQDEHDDLEVEDEDAEQVKGGSWHGSTHDKPDGIFHGG